MTKTIDTLVQDIQVLFDGHDLYETVDQFSSNLGATFVQRFKSYEEDREPTLRMSNLGKPLRQLFYELTGAPAEGLPPESKFKFLYGDILESLVLFLASEAGHKVELLQHEVEFNGVKGHIDAVIDGTLVDVKSASPFSFKKFRTGQFLTDDPFGYVGQLSSYWATFPEIPRAGFFAIDKVSGHLHFAELPQSARIPTFVLEDKIHTVERTVDAGVEPEKCYEPVPVSKTDKSGNLVLPVGCSYCKFRDYCWRDANNGEGLKTYFYSTGPKFFVHVEKEPRVQSYDTNVLKFPTKEETTDDE